MYDIIIGRNEKDKKKYRSKGTILLGKHYVKMGRTTSLSNKILLDVIRSHVMFVCGKRGGGKCVTGDTLITLDNGLEIPIKELEQHKNKVWSMDENFRLNRFEKADFYRREVEKILRIRLRSGKEIKLTPEHPLLTINGWKKAENMKIGSRIASPRKIDVKGEKLLKENEIKLLAYLIAEGHTKKSVLFSNSDPEIIDEFRYCLSGLDKELKLIQIAKNCYKVSSKDIKRKVLDYHINRDSKGRLTRGSSISHEKTPIRKFIEEHGLYGLGALEKFVPDKIMMSAKKDISLFLNRLFSCDGSIYKNEKNKQHWEACYSSSSPRLIRQVQSLLLRFEILSKIRYKKIRYNNSLRNSFELVISGENVMRFIEKIGFFGCKEKKQRLAFKTMEGLCINTNVDTIPQELWESYRPSNWAEVGKGMGYSNPTSLRSSVNYSPSRQKLMQIAKLDQNKRCMLLSQSDLFWDEIMSIEQIEEKTTVYDITVPEAHNFVANNIIVHNSYSMGVIAEGIADLEPEIKNNIAVIMLDTMGVYWTMKYPNKKDEPLLDEWGLKPKGLDVNIYTPVGYFQQYKDKGVPTDYSFSIRPDELDGSDWLTTFDIDPNEPIGVLIERIIHELRDEKKEFGLDHIIDALKNSKADKNELNAALNLFRNAKSWGLFDEKGTPLSELARPGQVTVLDVSCYATMPGSWRIKSLVIGLVAQKLFIQRMIARKNEEYQQVHKSLYYFSEEEIEKLDFPMVWLVVDEAHEFLPNHGKTLASDPLITILREGRQPGISLILASQQPGKIHTDVMTQSDTILAHRITAKLDTDALGALMQSYLRTGLDKYLDDLPRVKGAAIILDDSNEKLYPMRVRPRFSWHGGEAPTAIKEKDNVFG